MELMEELFTEKSVKTYYIQLKKAAWDCEKLRRIILLN